MLTARHRVKEPIVPDSAPIIDLASFGLEVRLLRMRRGFARPEQLLERIEREYGVQVSERTIWAIERGDQLPRIDLFLAIMAVLGVGLDYFYPTFNAGAVEKFSGER